MKVIGYTRVSTEEQADSRLGLEAQREAITAASGGREWTIRWIEDAGASGKDLRRAGIADALELLGAGKAKALVASKLDRVSRSVLDFVGLMDRSRREKWDLVILDLGLDTTTPHGEFVAVMMSALAQLERRLIGLRTREALAAKRARGEQLGRPSGLTDELVDRIVAARASGLTLTSIAGALNDDQVPTAQGGKRWYASTVLSVLERAGRTSRGGIGG